MGKIGALGGGMHSRRDKDNKKVKKKETSGVTFLSSLDKIVEGESGSAINEVHLSEGVEESFEILLDDLHEMGDRLKQVPTMTAVLEYKKAVKEFLRYVVTNSLEMEEKAGVKFANPLKKQKKYTMIKVIDQKIEQLAAGVLQNQRQQLDLLKAVDEIYGLLVDLLR